MASAAWSQEGTNPPEMVITATRVERALFDTPQAVSVLDDEAVEQANVEATPDFFRHAEGVYVQKTNLGGGSPFIRGLTGKQVLVLVDGIRLNNSFYRFGPHQYLNTIDPAIVERIETVRGPASVLYGSDALGGVINIITRRRNTFSQPADLDGLLLGRYDSAASGKMLRAQLEGNRGNLGWLGGVTGKDLGDVRGGGDIGKQSPSGYEEFDGDLKFNLRPDERREVIFSQQYTRQYSVPKTSEITLGDKLQFDYEPQQRYLGVVEYRIKRAAFFDEARLNVSYHRQKEGEKIIKASSPSTQTHEITEVQTLGAGMQFHNRLGTLQRLTYGLDYYRDEYDTRKTSRNLTDGTETAQTPGTPDGASYRSLGVYLQDEIRLGKRAELVPGLRYSRYETEGQIENQNLGLKTERVTASLYGRYRLIPSLNLVGGLAQGYRAPNMEDFFGRVDFFSEIPNTRLAPEESTTGEIGLKYYTGPTAAQVYYYQSDYDNLIERVTVGTQADGTPIKQRRNVRKARLRGWEAGVSHQIDRHWSAAATVMWVHGQDQDRGAPMRRIPPLNGGVQLRYTQTPRFWIELGGLFAQRQSRLAPEDKDDPRIPADGTPGYAVWSLKTAYQPSAGQQFLLTLENLTDRAYKTHGSGLYAPGRSAVVSYRLNFD